MSVDGCGSSRRVGSRLIELPAVLTGSAGRLGDAIRNLSDVSSSAVVFLSRLSRRPPAERYPNAWNELLIAGFR